MLSALKISGFSEYLHTWTEGKLLGVGYEADEDTGATQGVKLVMFDTGDKSNVTAENTLVSTCAYSPALYNHRAFLISYEHNIIAFPGDDAYYIYGYDEEEGFYERARVRLGGWSGNSRGMYIGDMIYVVSTDSVSVIDLNTFAVLSEVSL